jgi:hypothetical protein
MEGAIRLLIGRVGTVNLGAAVREDVPAVELLQSLFVGLSLEDLNAAQAPPASLAAKSSSLLRTHLHSGIARRFVEGGRSLLSK